MGSNFVAANKIIFPPFNMDVYYGIGLKLGKCGCLIFLGLGSCKNVTCHGIFFWLFLHQLTVKMYQKCN